MPDEPAVWQMYEPGQPSTVPTPVEYDEEQDHVPDGTVAEVLGWVGDDRDRAQLALDAEGERSGPPRRTLVAQLETLAAGD
jgi:hypothetical protein